MTNSNSDRLDKVESLLESFIAASIADRQASNERMTQLEKHLEESAKTSNERMTRIEQSVESNNRFLQSFSQDLRRHVDTMNNLAQRIDGVIAASNQGRDETNSRLAVG